MGLCHTLLLFYFSLMNKDAKLFVLSSIMFGDVVTQILCLIFSPLSCVVLITTACEVPLCILGAGSMSDT